MTSEKVLIVFVHVMKNQECQDSDVGSNHLKNQCDSWNKYQQTTLLRHPERYKYDFNLSEVWRRGSVISAWLLDFAAGELPANPNLDTFEGRVSDSGER